MQTRRRSVGASDVTSEIDTLKEVVIAGAMRECERQLQCTHDHQYGCDYPRSSHLHHSVAKVIVVVQLLNLLTIFFDIEC